MGKALILLIAMFLHITNTLNFQDMPIVLKIWLVIHNHSAAMAFLHSSKSIYEENLQGEVLWCSYVLIVSRLTTSPANAVLCCVLLYDIISFLQAREVTETRLSRNEDIPAKTQVIKEFYSAVFSFVSSSLISIQTSSVFALWMFVLILKKNQQCIRHDINDGMK